MNPLHIDFIYKISLLWFWENFFNSISSFSARTIRFVSFPCSIYSVTWFNGFCGDFVHSLNNICFHWDNRIDGFSALIRGRFSASYALKAAFSRFSGWRSDAASLTLKLTMEYFTVKSKRIRFTLAYLSALMASSIPDASIASGSSRFIFSTRGSSCTTFILVSCL